MPRQRKATPVERLTAATLEEIAKELGVSAMRVCQIEKVALAKLRVALIERKIVTKEGRYTTHNQVVR